MGSIFDDPNWLDEFNRQQENIGNSPSTTLYPTTPSTTVPSTTPSTTVPSGGSGGSSTGGQSEGPFIPAARPGLPTTIISAEEEERELYRLAKKAGIPVPQQLRPPTLPKGEEPTGDRPWWQDVGYGALNVGGKVLGFTPVSWTIGVLSAPSRVVLSTGKEVAESIGGLVYGPDYRARNKGSFSEWFNQIGDFSFGFKEAVTPEVTDVKLTPKAMEITGEGQYQVPIGTGNKWTDLVVEFGGEVLFDPLNYMTFGGATAAKTIAKSGSEMAAREITEEIAEEGLSAVRNRLASVDLAPAQAQRANKALDDLVGVGGRTGLIDEYDSIITKLGDLKTGGGSAEDIAQTEVLLESIGRTVRANTDELAVALGTKGGRVVAAEQARVEAVLDYVQKVNTYGSNSAEAKAAGKLVDQATFNLVRQASRGFRGVARRSYRMNAREELAEALRSTRQFAQTQLKIAQKTGNPLEEFYAATVNAITDDVIRDAAVRGWNAIGGDVARIIGAAESKGIGFGRMRFRVPGVRRLERGIGTAVIGARLKTLNAFGQNVVEAITPLGRRGIFAPSDVAIWRSALRTGNVSPEKAVELTALIDANKKSISLLNAKSREYAVGLNNVLRGITQEDGTAIRRGLETGVRPTAPDVAAKYDSVKSLVDGYYDEVNSIIKSLGGLDQPRVANYFPHIQSQDALNWIAKNKNAAGDVAYGLSVDTQYLADNFVQRTLQPGRHFFGHELTQADINAGIDRLNWMARNPIQNKFYPSGVKYTGKTEFFEPSLRKALAGYANTHARYVTTLESLKKLAGLPPMSPAVPKTIEGATSGAREIARRSAYAVTVDPQGAFKIEESLRNLSDAIDGLLSDPAVAQYLDESSFSMIVNRLRQIDETYQQALINPITPEGITYARLVDAGEVVKELTALTNDIQNITRALAASAGGLPPSVAGQILPLFGAAFDVNARLILNGLGLVESTLYRLPDDVFIDIVNMFDQGFEAFRLGQATMPKLAFNKDYQDLLTTIRSGKGKGALDAVYRNPWFKAYLGLQNFFKAYVTATVGFVVKNVTSNMVMLFAAGTDAGNALKALKYYTEFFGANRVRFIAGRPLLTPEEFVAGLKVAPTEKRRVLEALRVTDTSNNFFTDIFQESTDAGYRVATGERPVREAITRIFGERPTDILGAQVKPGSRFETTRAISGAIPSTFRGAGSTAENIQRFMLTYDGLAKGLNRTEALSRTNKYLFDYSELSQFDKGAKALFPFWYWASRNLPLQVELMLTEPRALSQIASTQRFLAEDEQNPNIPDYMRRSGAFTLREDLADPLRSIWNALPILQELDPNRPVVIAPETGFRGAGTETFLTGLAPAIATDLQRGFTDPQESPLEDALRTIAASTSPVVKGLIEQISGQSTFTGLPIATQEGEYAKITDPQQRLLRVLSDVLLPVGPWAARTGRAFGSDPSQWSESELIDLLLQARDPSLERMGQYTETQAEAIRRMEAEERERRLGQYLGVPIRSLTERQELAEIERRNRALRALLTKEGIKF